MAVARPAATRKRTPVPAAADPADDADVRYFNRELSWLEFNRRVLDEATDKTLPLLEQLKFLSIFSTNLDEFFMIRVSGLKEQIAENIPGYSSDGRSPEEQLEAIYAMLKPMLKTWLDDNLPAMVERLVRAEIERVARGGRR